MKRFRIEVAASMMAFIGGVVGFSFIAIIGDGSFLDFVANVAAVTIGTYLGVLTGRLICGE